MSSAIGKCYNGLVPKGGTSPRRFAPIKLFQRGREKGKGGEYYAKKISKW
nr:MAG TPA: hypothetical protein [Caudoviricetes sp.]